MVKILFAVILCIGLSAGINAQSKDCGAKDKADVTTVNKHCDVSKTVSTDTENTEQVAGALATDNTKKEIKTTATSNTKCDVAKDEKGCCSTDKKKTDDPNK